MAPASFTTGLALALFLVPGLVAAGPVLSGRFRSEPYGTLELKTEGDHVTATSVDGGVCGFDAQRQVLEGDFEGSVLVARLTVCQTGDLCPVEQTYSVLGFYNEEDNTLVAHVRLREGCKTSALPPSGRFVLSRPPPEVPDETPTSGTGSPAMDLASKRSQRSADAAKQIPELSKQLANNPRDPDLLYKLGYAYGMKGEKAKALDYLGRAVRAGHPLHESAESDPELKLLLSDDPQFQELLKKSREKKPRGMASSGNSSP